MKKRFILSIHKVQNLLVEGDSPEEALQAFENNGDGILYDGGILTYKKLYVLPPDSASPERAVPVKIKEVGP